MTMVDTERKRYVQPKAREISMDDAILSAGSPGDYEIPEQVSCPLPTPRDDEDGFQLNYKTFSLDDVVMD